MQSLPSFAPLFAAAAAFLALAAPGLATAQTVVMSDGFTLGGTRVAGGSLAETAPEQHAGYALWKPSHPNLFGVFSSDGRIVTRWRNNDPAQGALPTEMRITIPSASSAGVMTVSASLVTATSSWVGFGFFKSEFLLNDTSAWFKQENLLSVRLQPNGYWEVASHNGTTLAKLADGNIAGFSAASSYTMGLSYNTDTQMARIFLINGATEMNLYTANDGWFATGLASGTSVGATGFRLHPAGTNGTSSTAGAYSIDNIRVVSSIPEPSSAASLLGAGALAAFAVRRKPRVGARSHD